MKKNKIIAVILTIMMVVVLSSPIGVVYASEYDVDSELYDYYNDLIKSETADSPIQIGSSVIHIHDHAKLFTKQDKEMIIDKMKGSASNAGLNIVFLTYDDANGKTTNEFGDYYLNTLFRDSDDNVGFILDMDVREVNINTMGKVEENLSMPEINHCIDNGFESIADGDYALGLADIATETLKYADGKVDGVPGYDDYVGNTKSQLLKSCTTALIPSAIITIITGFSLYAIHNAANKKTSAVEYFDKTDGYKVIDKDENFERTYTTTQTNYYKQSSNNSSGRSGGGGGGHRSTGGRSHGGGGRRF